MERNNLPLNDTTKLSGVRYNAAKDPFVIYHFYNILGNTMKDLGIENRPYLFWKCDDSGLPHEPKKCKVISEKEQKMLQVSYFIFAFI